MVLALSEVPKIELGYGGIKGKNTIKTKQKNTAKFHIQREIKSQYENREAILKRMVKMEKKKKL